MFDIGKWGKAMRNDQEGFTLVELMVVVVIIAILVAIAIPIYNAITEGAERSAVEANLRTIDSAIMQVQAMGGAEDWELQEVTPAEGALDDPLGEFMEPIDSASDTDPVDVYGIINVGTDDAPRYRGAVEGEVGGHEIEEPTYLGDLPWNGDD